MTRWTADGQSLIQIDHLSTSIWKRPRRGDARVKIVSLTLPERVYNFAFSPDNTQLVIARGRSQSDALLIEDSK